MFCCLFMQLLPHESPRPGPVSDSAKLMLCVQLMDHNLIVPTGAIIVDNSLMKV